MSKDLSKKHNNFLYLLLKFSIICIVIGLIFMIAFQKDIAKINVTSSAFGVIMSDSLYDLENKQYWHFSPKDFEDRDIEAENNGYTFITDLEDEKIEKFLLVSRLCGFTHWNKSYVDEGVMDGDQWHITIYFKDGTEKDIYGNENIGIKLFLHFISICTLVAML